MNNNLNLSKQQPSATAEEYAAKHRVLLGTDSEVLTTVKTTEGEEIPFSGRPFVDSDGNPAVVPMLVRRGSGDIEQGWTALGILAKQSPDGKSTQLFYVLDNPQVGAKNVAVDDQESLLAELSVARQQAARASAGNKVSSALVTVADLNRPVEIEPEGHQTLTPAQLAELRKQIAQDEVRSIMKGFTESDQQALVNYANAAHDQWMAERSSNANSFTSYGKDKYDALESMSLGARMEAKRVAGLYYGEQIS